MEDKERQRVVVENLKPEIDCGRYPIKRVVGETVTVTADILSAGHDALSASLRFKKAGEKDWGEVPMTFMENDRWKGEFLVKEVGRYHYTVEAWPDSFKTWQRDLRKRLDAGQDLKMDLLVGAQLVEERSATAPQESAERLRRFARMLKGGDAEAGLATALGKELSDLMQRHPDRKKAGSYGRELTVVVDRKKAVFSTWYELFPRSFSPEPGRHGTFKDCERLLPEISAMGFDVLYLPPIHPIGRTNRKGKNNTLEVGPDDVGSPWAIGSEEGGHRAVHPRLGTLADFEALVRKAKESGIEIAMDLAFQCSPDHPYVKEHAGWFRWRPDGTVQCAENPPKKYEDIIPLHFETEDWKALWEELRSIVLFWIGKGIRIFRADNPHTKPFAFWDWLVEGIKREYPETLFLSEAFTRPKIMYHLAKLGFSQSYTFFTWRNTKWELTDYLTELTQTEVREFFRPNFWPNTPDILPEYLQYGGRPAFMIRLVLAATLASSYGIYGPAFELCIQEALPGKEEYLHSEKYEIKHWDRGRTGNLRDFVARMNRIRRENPALQTPWNLRFYEIENDRLLCFGKATEDLSNVILVVVNLDPFHTQRGRVRAPINDWGIDPNQPYLVHDLLSDDKFIWQGERNDVELNPFVLPANIFAVRTRLRREADFDYFL